MGKNKPGREIAIVISLGLLAALVITLIIQYRFKQNQPLTNPPSPSPTPLMELPEKTPPPIELTNLEDETVFENKSLTITGHTFPNLPVVIFVNSKDFVTTADDQGYFSLDFNLESGSNYIEAMVVDDQGRNFSDSRLVIYTNKSLQEIIVTETEVLQEATANAKKNVKTTNNNLNLKTPIPKVVQQKSPKKP